MRARRRPAIHTAFALVVALVSVARADDPVGSPTAQEAVARCFDADRLPESTRREALDHGLALAERAVAESPDDAVAHFAAFCLRGKRVDLDGLSLRLLGEIRLVRQDIDRALALAPDWPAALAGKGAILLTLPRLLGGDATEGERLLRRAIALDPASSSARDTLAKLLPSSVPTDGERTADAD
ncbi:MAG TPA: hypothetical protein VGR62_21320 [Candidatus Binatia bacterium]|nr:hypothetical protein [Candidatus Binatia bacterium]